MTSVLFTLLPKLGQGGQLLSNHQKTDQDAKGGGFGLSLSVPMFCELQTVAQKEYIFIKKEKKKENRPSKTIFAQYSF